MIALEIISLVLSITGFGIACYNFGRASANRIK